MPNSEESPPHKKRKMEESSSSSLLTSLPRDVTLNCMALLSRSDLAALSLTSKSYRSLVTSPDLYKIRSLIGHTETYVYVCIQTPPPDVNQRWYILRRRKTLASDLIPIPCLPSEPREASSVVVLNWGMYVIGGLIKGKPTSDVWLLDCRTHTWRIVPSMGPARVNAAAGVVDGKIYVFGGTMADDDSCWGEVFDPNTQNWDSLPIPFPRPMCIHDSVVKDQKIYIVDREEKTFYYAPSQGQWGRANRGNVPNVFDHRRDWCMIDNLIFCISKNGTIYWYESKDLDLREGEPEVMCSNVVMGL